MRLLLIILVFTTGSCQQSLPGYTVDLSSWTVSGLSAGACMATQMHVAYADRFKGVGMVAGVVYYCSEGSAAKSLNCMDTPSGIDVPPLADFAQQFADDGYNDPTSGIAADPTYIFQGSLDTVVYPENGPKAQEFYTSYAANITTEYSIAAAHGFPTDFYGGPCGAENNEYINNCGYNAAFEMMNHFYGNLVQPTPGGGTPTPGNFFEFDQREFFTTTTPGFWSMDTIGMAYVPSGCIDGTTVCKLHLVFHGCDQARESMGNTFATQTGYIEVGELNNIIMLFPQAVSSVSNPFGCWDWWGYNVYFPAYLFACRDSGQSLSIFRMMRQISSQPWSVV